MSYFIGGANDIIENKNNRAISLIALIITIIVIIILAAVVIGSALSTPEQANYARFCNDYAEVQSAIKTSYATEYGRATMNNQNVTKSQIYQAIALGTTDYSDITDVNKTSTQFASDSDVLGLTGIATPSYSKSQDWSINCETGEVLYVAGFNRGGAIYTTPNSYFVQAGRYKLTVPAGLSVAKLNSTTKNYEGSTMPIEQVGAFTENDINAGVVVIDGDGNEYVWVPCEVIEAGDTDDSGIVNYGRYEFTSATEATFKELDETVGTTYEEAVTGSSADPLTIIARDSVKKNGGFYVARYEAGSSVERKTAADALTKPMSKKNQYVYNYLTKSQAKQLSEEMYNTGSVGSKLISSFEWDTMLRWIQTVNGSNKNVLGSASWGNFVRCDQFEFTGKSLVDGATDYTDTTTTKVSADKYFLGTGVDTTPVGVNVANNIYDVAGNAWEWTTEKSTYYSGGVGYPCVYRGGCFNNEVAYFFAAYRTNNKGTHTSFSISFRPTLYIK